MTPIVCSPPGVRFRSCWLRALLLCGLLAVVFASTAWSAPIPEARARLVAQNVITEHVAIHGSWNGVQAPSIASIELVAYQGTPVAWNVRVSPTGHLLVAYDDEFSPVLLYSERSSFEPARVTDPTSIESWIIPDTHLIYQKLRGRVRASDAEEAEAYAQSRVGHAWAKFGKPANEFVPAQRVASANANLPGQAPSGGVPLDGTLAAALGPLLATTWDQGSPYNTYTPGVSGSCTHTYTGCTATAVAQVMKFWSWPSTGTGSSSYSWNGQTLSASYNHSYYWTTMPLALSGGSSSAEIDAVARLMSDVGIADQMQYSCSGSGASLYNAALSVLPTYFKYKRISLATGRPSYAGDQFFDIIKAELDLPTPRVALLEAWSPDGSVGHALVVDGYQMGSTNQVHLNLGWSGYSDGYYDITNNWLNFSGTDQTVYRGVEPDDGVTRAPAQPVLLSPAGALTAPKPTYSWAAVPGATSYMLAVTENGTLLFQQSYTTTQAACSSGGNCTVTPTTPLVSGDGSWIVRAVNSGGTGPDSDPLAFSTALATPAAPSNLSAMAAGSTQINLAWTDNASNETGFKVERSADGATGWSQIGTTGANVATYADIGLTCGSAFFYRVAATSSAGDSAYSNVASATTAGTCPPAAPSNLIATAAGSVQINLSWTDNAPNETAFKVERSLSSTSGWALVATTVANATTYGDAGLTCNTRYYYRVRATNGVGDSAYSNTANVRTAACSAPAAPSGLAATATGSTQISLSWTDNASNETGFKIERSLDGTTGWAQIGTAATNATSYGDATVACATAYYYRVRATNATGDSAYSNTATATTADCAPVTYTISGNVRDGQAGLAGVVLYGLPGSPTTDAGGHYSAVVTSNWSGTVRPAKPGYRFLPPSTVYSAVTDNSSADYVAQHVQPRTLTDYDGDGRSDLVRFQPSTGEWFGLLSSHNYDWQAGYLHASWGAAGDVPVPGDYDGDGKPDLVVFRPSTGEWLGLLSSHNYDWQQGYLHASWGAVGDVPVAGDYDGDGMADLVVFRPSTGDWWGLLSSHNYDWHAGYLHAMWGKAGDVAVPGDYDGDGTADMIVFRPSTGDWWGLLSSHNYDWHSGYLHVSWGEAGDVPVSGDYDGDGMNDVVVFRPTTGEWWGVFSSGSYDWHPGFLHVSWGGAGDTPVSGDYDGDGRADVVVFRPSTGEWWGVLSGHSYAWQPGYLHVSWGTAGDVPVQGIR